MYAIHHFGVKHLRVTPNACRTLTRHYPYKISNED